jgi:phage terminase small subunit
MAKHGADGLTDKQRGFVTEYLRNGRNGAAAYRTTYSTKASVDVSRVEAGRLLKHPAIAPLIAKAEERALAATNRVLEQHEINQEDLVSAMIQLVTYDIRDVVAWDQRKRCGGDGAGFELTIGAAADPAVKRLGW